MDSPIAASAPGNGGASAIQDIVKNFGGESLSDESLLTSLCLAATSDSPQLLLLLKRHLSGWKNKKDGRTVLHVLADANATECIEVVFEEELVTDASVQDHEGLSPAHLLVGKSNCLEGLAIILERMCDVNVVNKAKQTSLHVASLSNILENVELLLEHGASTNIQDNQGRTPLHCAAIGGCGAVAKTLCQSGASVQIKDSTGFTPFALAIRQGSAETVRELISHGGVDINKAVTANRDYPIHIAAEADNAKMLMLILEMGAKIDSKNKKGKTALFKLAVKDNLEHVKILLKNGSDCKALDKNGKSMIHCAIESRNYQFIETIKDHLCDHEQLLEACLNSKKSSALFTAIESNDLNGIKVLLTPSKCMADQVKYNKPLLEWNSPVHGGRSALSQAVFSGNKRATTELLACQADPCQHDGTGFTPLHYLVLRCEEDMGMLIAMMEHKTMDFNVTDTYLGCTPFALAAMELEHKTLVRCSDLRRDKNNIKLHCIKGVGLLSIDGGLTASPSAITNVPDRDGNSPLHFASMLGHSWLVAWLISKGGANVNAKNKDGDTPLHIVFQKKKKYEYVQKYISHFRKTEGFQPLATRLEKQCQDVGRPIPDADLREIGFVNPTPVPMTKHLMTMGWLVNLGADAELRNNKQQTALHLAASSDDFDRDVPGILTKMGEDRGRALMNCAYDRHGYLPLHVAAKAGSMRCAAYLLDWGADIKKR